MCTVLILLCYCCAHLASLGIRSVLEVDPAVCSSSLQVLLNLESLEHLRFAPGWIEQTKPACKSASARGFSSAINARRWIASSTSSKSAKAVSWCFCNTVDAFWRSRFPTIATGFCVYSVRPKAPAHFRCFALVFILDKRPSRRRALL